MDRRARAASTLCFVFFLLSGCVDPEGEFDEFVDRYESARAEADAGAPNATADAAIRDGGRCSVEPRFVDGTYLFALSVSLTPERPIVTLAEIATPEYQDGTGFTLAAQPLRADDRSTPVGELIELGPVAVQDDGDFVLEVDGLEVTGEANAISGGKITANVVLDGNLCGGPDFFCGTVSGMASQPLDLSLDGSTFTLMRLAAGEDPPARPFINCARARAEPLP